MHITRSEIPVKIDVPGAPPARPRVRGPVRIGALGGEYLSLGAGTDIAPLLQGLEGDACQAPHWGFMISGELVVTYTRRHAGDLLRRRPLLLAPGHSVRAVADSEFILSARRPPTST